jgi:hypothetical protein
MWIASYPKSGNTWTRAFLHNLMEDRDSPLTLEEIARRSPLDAERQFYAEAIPDMPDRLPPARTAAARAAVQRALAARVPGNLLVKTHNAVMVWHGHPTIDLAVSAGAIYVVRNPLDIVASYAAHSGVERDRIVAVLNRPNHVIEAPPFQVPQIVGDWSQHVESWTGRPNPGLHVMRYEDMLADPPASFGALVRFLRIEADEARIARAIAHSSFDTLQALEVGGAFAERRPGQERFFRRGAADGWRDELSEGQVAAIVARHRAQMARFGYLPDGH